MSLALPVTQRNVSLRGPARSLTQASPRPLGQEEDFDALIAMETAASASSRESGSRDTLARENAALQRLPPAARRERCASFKLPGDRAQSRDPMCLHRCS